jgi:hypothetical protein
MTLLTWGHVFSLAVIRARIIDIYGVDSSVLLSRLIFTLLLSFIPVFS